MKKKILLVGLTDQEAAAIEIMIGMNWRDDGSFVLRRSLSLAIPAQTAEALACTHCVVDLFGLGMRKYTPENAEKLLAFLAGRSAVALAWGVEGGGWPRQKMALADGQVLEFLLMPYTSHDMKTALLKVREGKVPLTVAASHAMVTQAAGTTAVGSGPAAAQMPNAVSAAAPVSAALPALDPDKEVGLLRGAFGLVLQAFPDLQNEPFFQLIGHMIRVEGPLVLRLSNDMSFILAVREGWIASPLPLINVAKTLISSPQLLHNARLIQLPQDRVNEELRLHFGEGFRQAQKPLDFLAWVLADHFLRERPPALRGDLRFRLRRFPNFTLLPNTTNFEIQLAAICSRAPQSLEKLCRSFPQHNPADIARFAIQCVVSGSAVALPAGPSKTASAPAPVQTPKTTHVQQAARKGFFKSLLAKLF